MQAVLRKSDGVALYLLPDDTLININRYGLSTSKGLRALDIRPETHEIVEGVPAPSFFAGAAMAWDGQWSIVNPDVYDAAVQAAEAARRAALKTTRARFALAAFSAGVITDVEAEAWAGGTALPQIVTDAFAENISDPTERLAARIEALTTANIHRTNPLILMLQANPRIDLTDEQADALFG